MEVKMYNPIVVMTKPKTKTKLEVRGLTLENKQKLDTIYAKCFVKTSKK